MMRYGIVAMEFPVCVIAVFCAFSDPAFRDSFPGLCGVWGFSLYGSRISSTTATPAAGRR